MRKYLFVKDPKDLKDLKDFKDPKENAQLD